MSIRATSISKGNAPASSIVLKKMGAIFPPIQTEPARLFGTQGTCVVLRVDMAPLSASRLATGAATALADAHAVAPNRRRRRVAQTKKGRGEITSSPMYHSTEFVADLRELPVPTTSPT